MKRIIINIGLLTSLLIINTSCRDAIDIIQEGELNIDNGMTTINDMDMFLQGSIYNSLNNSNQISFTSQFTDEVGIGPSNSNISSAGTHQFYIETSNAFASAIWQNDYLVINRVNRLLEGAKKITPATTEVAKYNSILGEARAARALAYLDLFSYFSPNMKDPNALGVIIVNGIPTLNDKPQRSNNSEIYKAIEDDLNFAEQNISQNASNYLYFTINAINAIRARYYTYKGDYTNAKTYAQKVISQSGLTLTTATPTPTGTAGSTAWWTSLNAYGSTNPYVKMLQDGARGEVIFGFSRPLTGSSENIATLYTTNTSTYTGSVIWDMGRNLYNIIANSPGDIRRYAYLDVSSKIDPNYLTSVDYKTSDGLVIKKYPGKYTGALQLKNDIKVIRLSEMYLILAECAASSNDLAGVATNLKAIRDARNYQGPTTLPIYSNTTQAWQDILKERRVELAFEGHRYIDLRRLGKIAGVSIDRSIVDDMSKTLPITLSIDDYRFTLPIPRDELQGNPTIQQNTGYANQ
ncbi:RagB/SusD family nutrient uptake outer membrane protein [Elizabethkingia anophelis]|uniref:SusD family n=3 Tax=Elizabethkingia anophelis TaxID=1117645 RepID=A0A7Z7LTZ6_9FLAO|nr:RagB/SusD family nutrient uptake outer membrane protein [Elizabethkingia anophelis]AQW91495.1 SusD/RagB family protein [Elizabethkingia anophelis]EJC8061898.1 RagB/SusD family nutrient uptake outer membrane protein [Elizabethkingia anophelis]KUY18619.1 SusD/RagB family protein [Elizabethkingia anophelis]MCT3631731.1 RagB/SusD family nutrient uptake outer membrane protein [Elizabethkingia anophelis]MCT3635245.1 RagB/SusD family nutrient uptake outer membrane protein [Elizabethkingia anopheli